MTHLKVKIESFSGTQKKITVEVPKERAERELEEAFRKIQRAAALPGFRAGRVPRPLIEKNFQSHAREEMLKQLLPNCMNEAALQVHLDPITIPKVSDIQFHENGTVVFQAEFDVKPEVKVKFYKGIKLTKAKVQITQEEVEKVLKNILEQNAEYQVIENRAAQEGDYLVCEVVKASNGKPSEKRQRVWLYLDKTHDPEKIVDQLLGAAAGEKRRVKALVKENETAEYDVHVREIKEKHLPVLDDAFAKNTANVESVSSLREDIEKKLKEEKERQAKWELEAELLDYLIGESKFDLPESLVRSQAERLAEEAKQRLLAQGFGQPQLNDQEEAIRQRVKPQAERQVKIHFILQEIALQEKMLVEGMTQEKIIEFLLKEAKIVIKDS
jgi:trigger factor